MFILVNSKDERRASALRASVIRLEQPAGSKPKGAAAGSKPKGAADGSKAKGAADGTAAQQ